MHYCEILGVAQAYEDVITIEVVTRQIEIDDIVTGESCQTAVELAREIGYNRLLTGEDLTTEGSRIMNLYFEYKNSVLDAIIKSVD